MYLRQKQGVEEMLGSFFRDEMNFTHKLREKSCACQSSGCERCTVSLVLRLYACFWILCYNL